MRCSDVKLPPHRQDSMTRLAGRDHRRLFIYLKTLGLCNCSGELCNTLLFSLSLKLHKCFIDWEASNLTLWGVWAASGGKEGNSCRSSASSIPTKSHSHRQLKMILGCRTILQSNHDRICQTLKNEAGHQLTQHDTRAAKGCSGVENI